MSLRESGASGMMWTGDAEASRQSAIVGPDIRLLQRKHEGELCRLLLGLDAPARCGRFGQAASDAYLTSHARTALANADCVLGGFIGERLRGVAEVYNDGPNGFAEAAFVVEQEWRRRGLGWALLRAAMRAASDCRTNKLRLIFSRHNWPMRKLASKASGKLDIVLDEISVDVDLDEGNRSSWADATRFKIGVD